MTDQLIAGILTTYNASAEPRRKIYKGVIGRTGLGTSMTYENTSWRSAWDLISGLCTDKGGILRLRYADDGARVLDWLDHCGNWAEQIVTWGDNLVSLLVTEDASKVVNTIIATGQTEQHESISVTVSDAASVAQYGTIAVQRSYDAQTAAGLQALARADLDRESKASRLISGQAIDRLPEDKAPFRVGDFVLVRSVPHRIEEWSVISEISIDLTEDKPPQIAFGAISTGLTAPERTASINRWLVSLQGQAPLEVYAIDLDGYYAIDSDGYYAVADGSGL